MIYLRSSSRALANRRKKREKEIQKIEYLENEESCLDEISSIFHNLVRAIIC